MYAYKNRLKYAHCFPRVYQYALKNERFFEIFVLHNIQVYLHIQK